MGEGYTKQDAINFAETVRLQAERFPTARRVLLFESLTGAERARLAQRIHSATLQEFEVTQLGHKSEVSGQISVSDVDTASYSIGLQIEIIAPTKQLTKESVTSLVTDQLHNINTNRPTTPLDLGTQIYDSILDHFSPGRRGHGTIRIDDVGDVQILLNSTADGIHVEFS